MLTITHKIQNAKDITTFYMMGWHVLFGRSVICQVYTYPAHCTFNSSPWLQKKQLICYVSKTRVAPVILVIASYCDYIERLLEYGASRNGENYQHATNDLYEVYKSWTLLNPSDIKL